MRATKAEIQAELALIAARCNGLISREALLVWADDLSIEHDFAIADYREAGRRMPDRIAEGGRGAMAGRPQITDIVALAKEARARRLEAAAAASSTRRLEPRNERTAAELAATAKTASWVIAQVQAGAPPTESAIAEYRAARVAEMGETMSKKEQRDPKFYTARTKRAVNSLTVKRGPKVVSHE